jgi:hypothetical protein
LNPLDARMIAAWFLGWSAWTATLAFARDWDEIRLAVRLNIINGLALAGTIVAFLPLLNFNTGTRTTSSYVAGVIVLTAAMIAFHIVQERRRPRPVAAEDAPGAPGAGATEVSASRAR